MNLFVFKVLLFQLEVAIVITHPILTKYLVMSLSRNLGHSKLAWNQGCQHEW